MMSHLAAEDPRLMLSEMKADTMTSLLTYIVGKSVGCDQRHLNHFMQVLESWLAVANIHFDTSDAAAGAAGGPDPAASQNMVSIGGAILDDGD